MTKGIGGLSLNIFPGRGDLLGDEKSRWFYPKNPWDDATTPPKTKRPRSGRSELRGGTLRERGREGGRIDDIHL